MKPNPRLRVAHRLLLAGLALAPGRPIQATAQQRTRPGPCSTTAEAGEDWTEFSFGGLRLQLSLPPDLRPLSSEALRGVARRARTRSMPLTSADSAQLLAAWEAPAKAAGDIRQVLLYAVRPDSAPPGRPCALAIAQQPGFVFRVALSGEGRDEYWMEAHWGGFLLAAGGRSLRVYDIGFGILRSVGLLP